MPKYKVRVQRLSPPGTPAQDYDVDAFHAIDDASASLDGPTLIYNPAAVAVMLVLPTAAPETVAPAPPATVKAPADAK